ncbi:hypothetical protein ES319_D03G152800v1 [Gossypium barbadense]|uniref:Dirigent protein n=1 Tax=Gossypium barbadense TaxID=3634 RepID=A0A5J5S4G3_GOSBA|nr:hypothetical protein ES319_D03G152800v1 [Gossypium barbadense]
MVKELRFKGTLHLLLLAITTKYYVNGTRFLHHDDTLPPLPTPIANTTPVIGPAMEPSSTPMLSFYMHDIFGGSTPSVRVVAGVIAIAKRPTPSQANGIPFSKKRSGIITNKGIPLPSQATLQRLLFGAVTVIDDELTQGCEYGSSIMGKAQGFYVASSMDGSSHTMAFTAMFHDEDDHYKDDAISFFGVHRTAAVESPIAIVGGTGKYENAQGYAVVETLPNTNQYTVDGVDTLLQFSVFITRY